MRNRLSIILVFSISVLLMSQFTGVNTSLLLSCENHVLDSTNLESFVVSDPFVINGTDDFLTQGFPGNGLVDTPFIIEGLTIDTTGNCIEIFNTDAYFEIRNCQLIARDNNIGMAIHLTNVTNAAIDSCELLYGNLAIHIEDSSGCRISNTEIIDSTYGVFSRYSGNIDVEDSFFDGQRDAGIGLYFTDNCTLQNNTILNAEESGFWLYESDNCYLSDNIVRNSGFPSSPFDGNGIWIGNSFNDSLVRNIFDHNKRSGIHLMNADDCLIQGNFILRNQHRGCNFEGANDVMLKENFVYLNNEIGVHLYVSHNSIIQNNTIVANQHGIAFTDTDSCDIIDNLVSLSMNDGIALDDDSTDIWVYGNIISGNYRFDGKDNGSSNNWHDGISTGNVWSNYTGPGSYVVPGFAGSIDFFPTNGDHTPPIINKTDNIDYELGNPEQRPLNWTTTDSNITLYIVNIDGEFFVSNLWNSTSEEVVVDASGLSEGVHEVLLVGIDHGGNNASSYVNVTVLPDTTLPYVEQLTDRTVAYGEVVILQWEVFDWNPVHFDILVNGVVLELGGWDKGITMILVVLNDLQAGSNEVKLVLTDLGGNVVASTVWIEVEQPPITSSPTTGNTTTPGGELPLEGLSLIITAASGAVILVVVILILRAQRQPQG